MSPSFPSFLHLKDHPNLVTASVPLTATLAPTPGVGDENSRKSPLLQLAAGSRGDSSPRNPAWYTPPSARGCRCREVRL